jgi:predicted acetyltransferase
MPVLVTPSTAYKASYIAAVREFQAEGLHMELSIARLEADFDRFVADLRRRTDPATLPAGYVPETVLWLVDDVAGEFLGRVSIRHTLNDWLRTLGGHIGYEIRPAQRRRGYGTQILRLALPHAGAMGLTRVLITCDATNTGSRKIIEHNGGQFENAVDQPGDPVKKLRYWIDLA